MGEGGEFGGRHFFGEATEVEVGSVHLEDHRGAGGDGFFVVVEVGFVGGAHFNELGSGCFQDIGDAEAAADFDELASRDDHFIFAILAEVAENDDEGGGAVIDGGRGIGFEQGGEGGFEVAGPFAACAIGKIEFEVAVACGDVGEFLGSALAEGGSAEIGVNDHSGGVDDGLESAGGKCQEVIGDGLLNVVTTWGGSIEDLLSDEFKLPLHKGGDKGAGQGAVTGKFLAEDFNRWQGPKCLMMIWHTKGNNPFHWG